MSEEETAPNLSCEDPDILERCEQLFSQEQEYVLVSTPESLAVCRAVAALYIEYDIERPRGWKRVRLLSRVLLVMLRRPRRAPCALHVCSRALSLGWRVVILTTENRVLLVRPSGFTPLRESGRRLDLVERSES